MIDLIHNGNIRGNLVGITKESAILYPQIYKDAQRRYIEKYFAQDHYLGNYLLIIFLFENLSQGGLINTNNIEYRSYIINLNCFLSSTQVQYDSNIMSKNKTSYSKLAFEISFWSVRNVVVRRN